MKKIPNILKYICAILLIVSASNVKAQTDPHFSQYYANPLWLNPALTGVIDGEYRVTANFKQQWSALSNSFVTAGASVDIAPTKNLALGLSILDQKAGELNFNYFNASISASYRVHFGNDRLQILNFGIQGGIINRSFEPGKGQYGNQYNPSIGYDPNLPSNETFANKSALSADLGAGVMFFDGDQGKLFNVFAGLSVAHINRPTESFLGTKVAIPMRYIAHGGARVRITDLIDLTPNLLVMRQAKAHETSLGAYAQMMMNNSSTLLFGANYRFNDAGIAFVGVQFKNMVFGFSYDLNTSSFKNATKNNGGIEFSASYISRNGLIAPNFYCPRL